MRQVINSDKRIIVDQFPKTVIVKTDPDSSLNLELENFSEERMGRLKVLDEQEGNFMIEISFLGADGFNETHIFKRNDEGLIAFDESEKQSESKVIKFGKDLAIKIKNGNVEINKKLENKPNGFVAEKIEVTNNFIAFTLIDEENEAFSFQRNLYENGAVLHCIGGYIKNDQFVSEGEIVEPLDMTEIVERIKFKLKKSATKKLPRAS